MYLLSKVVLYLEVTVIREDGTVSPDLAKLRPVASPICH